MDSREKELIINGSPCDTNYFDKTLLRVEQVREKGRDYCPNFQRCENGGIYCALDLGIQVARHVSNGKTLQEELEDFSYVPFINEEFWNSVNRREFTREKGKAKILAAVEGFARVVLLMDVFESVLPRCGKCNGVKLVGIVYDSIWEFPRACAGSGRTRKRDFLYCPDCDPKPIGGILTKDPDELNEREFLERIRKHLEGEE